MLQLFHIYVCNQYPNKRVICKLTITLRHKMAAPMWSKIAAPMWTQDGCYKMAATRCPTGKGSCGKLEVTRPPEESSWGEQASRGEQLGETRPAREGSWEEPRPAGEGSWGVPGLQGRAVEMGGRSAREVSWEPAVLDCKRDVQTPI
uniref:Uncharacterized protein n=1 Tax=Pipistrellus kuhlii TaxID=59472 RepID=A0A7J7XUY9_PIPKU|nr:hypothetical protein mPipKuh1_010438 [Pipistrellus kuhlii]